MSIINCETEEQLSLLKEKAMKTKVIALDKMDKHPLMNPSTFSKRDKATLMMKMGDIFNDWSDEQINKEFNDIVNDRILAGGIDYQHYPVYDLSKKKEIAVDCGGNLVECEANVSTN